ncbi:hypothetical protein JY651_32180 [Pyxidicoccus parkwayensis]|uniref:Lipoprotein n=1 Tax=Pyxidicoccus parkwayensis TaxID=2813578 RepID=A0ABX7NM29_9BACT|nr:hypothetical protein [Pyxidicoccus parkwaysis]QSQ19922.1 hypothetical protein JY651_32180 [Pyxidicoccus parkwaysis]
MRFDWRATWVLVLLVLACGPGRDGEPCEASCAADDAACLEQACTDSPEEAMRAATDCASLPEGGRCLGTRVVERCLLGVLLREDCEAGEACVVEGAGARCAEGVACVDGVTRCSEAGGLEACVEGRWRSRECTAGCVDAGGRGWCGAPGNTLSGTVRYARRRPDASFRDWTPEAEWMPAGGFLIASYRGDTLVDLEVTDSDGQFTVRVPDGVQSRDRVVVYAAGRGSPVTVDYAVADPALSGEQSVSTVPGAAARIWSWSRSTQALMERPVFSIAESEGSGAAAVFDSLRVAWLRARERYGSAGLPVVAWLGFGTTWSCGACFASRTVTAAGRKWAAQVWLPGDGDAAWWSEAMVLHELGHWVMASHGTSPEEGGPHFIGVPTFPGQAWSEGWATWFSSDARNSSRYYDRQDGTMFWVDLAMRVPAWGSWTRPKAEDGLFQRIDENEVAAILYRLGRGTSSRQSLYEALAAPAMNASPWARGYLRHRWRMEGGNVVDAEETGESAPCLADFLDAMMCRGFSRSVMDMATEPSVAYPYPSHAPLCR